MLKWIKIDVSLGEGDLLIMMSDGIIEKREDHVFERIQHLTTTDPQAIADFLLDEAILDNKQIIADDMTVIVARLDRFKSKWQTIPYQAIEQYSYG
jgi:stage II sporulation protein E